MLSAIMALAQLVPAVGGLFKKASTAGKIASVVSSTAQLLTGSSTDDKALKALQADPELLAEYVANMNAHAATMYEAETDRLEIVNDTIQKDAANDDGYVRRMRPTFGYAMALALVELVNLAVWAVIWRPEKLGDVTAAIIALVPIFQVGLAVLGMYVWKRSSDKKPARPGLLAGAVGLVSAIRNK